MDPATHEYLADDPPGVAREPVVTALATPPVETPPGVRPEPRPKSRFAPLLLASPATAVLVVVFVVPLCFLLVVSFYPDDPLTGMAPGFTFANYSAFWTEPYFFRAIGLTFGFAVAATVASAAISYPLALILNRRGRRLRVTMALIVVMPIFVSIVERSLGWIAIFGANGLLDSVSRSLGLQLPSLLYTKIGVIIGLANTLLPFMFLSIYAAVRQVDPLVRSAAATLGASPAKVFLKVTLPLTLPGLSAGATLVFSLAASNVITTMMIGGSGVITLPTLLYEEATVVVNYPASAVIGISMSVLILIVANLILRITRARHEETVVLPQ